jgi:Uncharacterized conserved protein
MAKARIDELAKQRTRKEIEDHQTKTFDQRVSEQKERERQQGAARSKSLKEADDAQRTAIANLMEAETAKGAGPSGALNPGTVFRDCPECPEMVVVPAGEFMMGSPASEEGRYPAEGPQRKQTIAKPFAVGKFEVTFAEWAACVAGGGCAGNKNPEDRSWGRGKRPVIYVSWNDATEYVEWLSKTTGWTYRLLTEAEWEYVARAGTTTPFSTGRTITPEQANFNGSYGGVARGVYRRMTTEVGTFLANAFGLYDVHGNVWEWVQDCYDSYAGAPKDGSAITSTDCGQRVLRGGSWGSGPQDLRLAKRYFYHPVVRDGFSGFRVARTL